MKVKELIEKLKEFDPDSEIEFEFEESSNEGDTWLLRLDRLMKRYYYKKESALFNFKSEW